MSDLFLKRLEIVSGQGKYAVKMASARDIVLSRNSIAIIDDSPHIIKKIDITPFLHTFSLKATEQTKNVENCLNLLEQLAKHHIQRDSTIYAFGGGIIQDLTTLTASIYMRGLRWNFIPTTLMSMMDSCIGGKSSLNLKAYKNIVGNFYPPSKIFIDVEFIDTLSKVDISSGISEGLKITYAKSTNDFKSFHECITKWRTSQQSQYLEQAIFISLQAKKWFIEVDEYDRNERKLLNFGHSFGHALESASDFKLPHGIGVLLGMKAAIHESGNLEVCIDLFRSIERELVLSNFDGTSISISKKQFVAALARDKKNTKSKQVLILPNSTGELTVVERQLNEDNLQSCWNSMLLSINESRLGFEIF